MPDVPKIVVAASGKNREFISQNHPSYKVVLQKTETNNPIVFFKEVVHANPADIYGLLVGNYEFANSNSLSEIYQFFENIGDKPLIVYSDYYNIVDQRIIKKVLPTFEKGHDLEQFMTYIPIFISKHLIRQEIFSMDFNYMVSLLLNQILSIHIPKPLFINKIDASIKPCPAN